MKTIKWTAHAMQRFLVRAALHGLFIDDIEREVEKQEVRISKGISPEHEGEKFRTIFPAGKTMITVEKAETARKINIITLWESSIQEVELWKRMTSA